MNMPKQNLCMLDRGIRGIVGVVTIYFGLFGGELIGEPIVQGILLIFGIANIISLLTGWCIVYHFSNISSIK